MLDIKALQKDLHNWQVRNFGESSTEDQSLGVTEEIGEFAAAVVILLAAENGRIAHAILKNKQGIRNYSKEKTRAEIEDAIGDIFIYMLNMCTHMDMDLEDIYTKTAASVLKRDWKKNPTTGEANGRPTI